ncbi:MAG TPA: hypothetical protein VFX43_01110, partial [Chitinophagaceae bacterium]|nr:hypothetical protein [Chitinophagaceae bacterium]
MNWKLLLLLFSVVVTHAPARAGDTTLYVSPRGSGNGSRLSPASLQRAVAMLPELKKMNGKGAITIVLRNGTYELNEPICITPQNGGTKTLKIIFKAELNAHPVISGGKKVLIKGKGVLSANISALLKDGVPQDIYINGKRAIRARTPNTGFLKFTKVSEKKPSGIPWNKTTSVQCFEIPMATYKELKTLSSRQLRN